MIYGHSHSIDSCFVFPFLCFCCLVVICFILVILFFPCIMVVLFALFVLFWNVNVLENHEIILEYFSLPGRHTASTSNECFVLHRTQSAVECLLLHPFIFWTCCVLYHRVTGSRSQSQLPMGKGRVHPTQVDSLLLTANSLMQQNSCNNFQ